ncbi:MAG: hypothetical protein KAS32_10720 [Candidatus Peribacteraceae bacterium]|nr:hypothetical protein [Candidatus Peribacteraceae bacterium]
MSGGGKTPKLPPAPDPIPTPEDIDIEATRKAEDVRKKLRSRAGRAGTILTESTLGIPDVEKETILG